MIQSVLKDNIFESSKILHYSIANCYYCLFFFDICEGTMMNPNMMGGGMPSMGAPPAMAGMPPNMMSMGAAAMIPTASGMGTSTKRKSDAEDRETKRKGRKKGFVWSHVTIDEATQKVCCLHCGENIKINFGEKVERLRKHFIKSCPKSPFQADSKEYEELLECISSPPIEQKKKSFAGWSQRLN